MPMHSEGYFGFVRIGDIFHVLFFQFASLILLRFLLLQVLRYVALRELLQKV